MKYATEREYLDPEKSVRKLLEIASTIEPDQDGRIHIEKINAPFLHDRTQLSAIPDAPQAACVARRLISRATSSRYGTLPCS